MRRVLSAGDLDQSVTLLEISPFAVRMPINVSVGTGFTFGASVGAAAGAFTLQNFCSGLPPDQWPPPGK